MWYSWIGRNASEHNVQFVILFWFNKCHNKSSSLFLSSEKVAVSHSMPLPSGSCREGRRTWRRKLLKNNVRILSVNSLKWKNPLDSSIIQQYSSYFVSFKNSIFLYNNNKLYINNKAKKQNNSTISNIDINYWKQYQFCRKLYQICRKWCYGC